MLRNDPFVPQVTETQIPDGGSEKVLVTEQLLDQAIPFLKFDTGLSTMYDEEASKALGHNYWRVTHSFKYYVGEKEDDCWVYVPAGYLTDGASVPRLFWMFVPPWGLYGQAAVVHDILCETYAVHDRGVETRVSRAYVDAVFKEAMKVAGVPKLTYWAMYCGLRFFSKIRFWELDSTKSSRKVALQESWDPTTAPDLHEKVI